MKRFYEHPRHFVFEIHDQALGELIPDSIKERFLCTQTLLVTTCHAARNRLSRVT